MERNLNTKELYDENREKFDEFMRELSIETCKFDTTGIKFDSKHKVGQLHYKINKLNGNAIVVAFKDKSDRLFYFDVTNGLYLESINNELQEWISNKSNNRRYQNIDLGDKSVMVPDYWLELALMAKLEPDMYNEMYELWVYGKENYRRYTADEKRKLGLNTREDIMGPIHDDYEINHISGDTYDCAIDNLEVITSYLNKCHSRLMSEISYYHPDIVETVGEDCKNNVMHRFTSSKFKIDCNMIDEYNKDKKHKTKIKPYKDKNGKFRPRFTAEEIDNILNYFGINYDEVMGI